MAYLQVSYTIRKNSVIFRHTRISQST